MAYNLQPLITILDQILDADQQTYLIHDDNKPQLISLLEKAISLQQIIEKNSSDLPKLEISLDLERQIRDAAHKAEDIIESYMVRQMLRSRNLIGWLIKRVTFSSADLQQVMQELDSAKEQVVKLVEVEAGKKKMISSRGSSSSSGGGGGGGGASLNPKSVSGSIHVVGFDEDLMELKDRLTGMQSKLEIIPIVGMDGVGKTTLARNLYEDPHIVSRFQYARAWATVSQDYNLKTIILSLLSCIIEKDQLDELIDRQVTVDELKDVLYKSLYGRRYMVVLDDIWTTKARDEMRMYFPDNNNGSRIVITTRESNVANYPNSQSRQHEVQLLSEPASWNLLRQIVFGEDDCPVELESIGRKMASDCGGLPLAITVIGGLLSKLERLKDVWERIGENVRGALIAKSDGEEQYSNIMSLSYKHLPNYLKPCFLYMGAFPEDYEIKGSRLIRLWIAEGFIKSNRDKSLEEEAEDYLKGLVERNLVMVRRNKSNRKPMSYIIHDLLRDLCIRKADEDNFLHVMTKDRDRVRGMISKLRRVVMEKSYSDGMTTYMYASTELMSHARSFLVPGISKLRRVVRDKSYSYASTESISHAQSFLDTWYKLGFVVSNLLRVLDIMQVLLQEFPKEILQLVNLRYLGVWCDRLPVGISRLVNLQTLITDLKSYNLPSEIWTMSGLRHLKIMGDIWRVDDIKKFVEMNKLQTISSYLELSESLLERGFLQTIPNIKNLGLYWSNDSAIDLSHLHKLETFRYRSVFNNGGCRFPPTLRKLTLVTCNINWSMARTLCGLPNLEVLKIIDCMFLEVNGHLIILNEWEAREGEQFRSLQFLQLDNMDLVRWRADETNFPKLRHLLLRKCKKLEEIPSGIGEIPSLELIEIKKCSASSVESARQILDVQQSEYDNYALQLRIHE